jgi:hypothetical protein
MDTSVFKALQFFQSSCTVGTGSPPQGLIDWGMALTTCPPSNAEVKERVELYL